MVNLSTIKIIHLLLFDLYITLEVLFFFFFHLFTVTLTILLYTLFLYGRLRSLWDFSKSKKYIDFALMEG